MRGGRRGGPWSEEEIASSGTGSERAKVASVAERKPPASTWHREARTGEGDVLHHDPDLLRERRPPPRPRLHADRLRRAPSRTTPSPAHPSRATTPPSRTSSGNRSPTGTFTRARTRGGTARPASRTGPICSWSTGRARTAGGGRGKGRSTRNLSGLANFMT